MRRILASLGRLIGRLIPSRYEGRRDRLSAEADQAASAAQFRGGM
ncbi:hypothetical protein [Ilumatobacter sp.]